VRGRQFKAMNCPLAKSNLFCKFGLAQPKNRAARPDFGGKALILAAALQRP
jgi:hypothetical protein